jgi:hypothetical protein
MPGVGNLRQEKHLVWIPHRRMNIGSMLTLWFSIILTTHPRSHSGRGMFRTRLLVHLLRCFLAYGVICTEQNLRNWISLLWEINWDRRQAIYGGRSAFKAANCHFTCKAEFNTARGIPRRTWHCNDGEHDGCSVDAFLSAETWASKSWTL